MDRKHKVAKKLYKYDDFKNLKEMLSNSKEKYGDNAAFKFKTEIPGKLRTESYAEFVEKVDDLGTALISVGLEGKRIAVIGDNRYEWALAYLAVVCGAGIIVPLDKSLPENELISLVERSEVEAIFYSDKYNSIMDKIKEEKIGKVSFFISMDADKTEKGVYSQSELVELGKGLIKNGAKSYIDKKINNDEMSIMLFTSGTTSAAKAVMLSHTNIVTNIHDVTSVFDVGPEDTMLSFLPLHHTFECTLTYLFMTSVGGTIAICEGLSNADWLNACAHGAGRKMSRSKAKQNVSMDEFKESMKNVYSTTVCKGTIDESPMAYKDTNEIKDLITETCKIKFMMIPKINIKAADGGD